MSWYEKINAVFKEYRLAILAGIGCAAFFFSSLKISGIYFRRDFYWFIDHDVILKQQDKLDSDPKDMKIADVITSVVFCNRPSFKVYMYWFTPLNDQIRTKKVCGELQKIYNSYIDV